MAAFKVVKVANAILIEEFLNTSKGFIGDNGQCAISVNAVAVESTPRDSDLSVSMETAKKKTTLGDALKLPISPCSVRNVEDVKIHGKRPIESELVKCNISVSSAIVQYKALDIPGLTENPFFADYQYFNDPTKVTLFVNELQSEGYRHHFNRAFIKFPELSNLVGNLITSSRYPWY